MYYVSNDNKELKRRVNTFMSDDIYNYVKQTSADMSMSISAFINMCVCNYKNAQEVTNFVSELKKLNDDLKKLKDK